MCNQIKGKYYIMYQLIESECPVCYENADEQINVIFPCKHSMCISCFCRLKEFSCSLCRRNLQDLVPDSIKVANHAVIPEGTSSILA